MGSQISRGIVDDDIEESDAYSISGNTEASDEEEEPIAFTQLPHDLQCSIIEKFDYTHFSNFERTSLFAHSLCSSQAFSVPFGIKSVVVNKKTMKCMDGHFLYSRNTVPRIPWNVTSGAPVRISAKCVWIADKLSSGRMKAVTSSFEKNRTTVHELIFCEDIAFPADDLDRFIQVASPSRITFSKFLPRDYFTCPSLLNAIHVTFERTGCTDEELVKINSPSFSMKTTNLIRPLGLNRLLKQWKRGEREINSIRITSDSPIGRVEDILHGIEVNLIWSWDGHDDTILHSIPLEELPVFAPGEYIYSIWNPNDLDNTLFIYISEKTFSVWKDFGESELILRWVNPDQYYVLQKKCMFCLSEFCEHRRRYSTVRLQKRYPRTYSYFIFGIQFLGVVSASVCVLYFITGERPYYRATSSDHELIEEETGASKLLAYLRIHLFDCV